MSDTVIQDLIHQNNCFSKWVFPVTASGRPDKSTKIPQSEGIDNQGDILGCPKCSFLNWRFFFFFKIFNTLATWCKELTHWKRPWCWERLKAGGEGNNRGWDGWMASPTQWTWVWASFGSWWWTGKPGMRQSMGLQRVGHDWVTELIILWMAKNHFIEIFTKLSRCCGFSGF